MPELLPIITQLSKSPIQTLFIFILVLAVVALLKKWIDSLQFGQQKENHWQEIQKCLDLIQALPPSESELLAQVQVRLKEQRKMLIFGQILSTEQEQLALDFFNQEQEKYPLVVIVTVLPYLQRESQQVVLKPMGFWLNLSNRFFYYFTWFVYVGAILWVILGVYIGNITVVLQGIGCFIMAIAGLFSNKEYLRYRAIKTSLINKKV